MKKLLVAVSAISLFAACHEGTKQATTAASSGSFTIAGTITGLDSGKVYLMRRVGDSTYRDSTLLDKGSFAFKGLPVNTGLMYTLSVPGAKGGQMFQFFAGKGDLTIKGTSDSINKSVVTGSPVQDQYLAYQKYMQLYTDRSENLMKIYQAAAKGGTLNKVKEDSLGKAFDTLDMDRQAAIIAYVKQNPASVVGAWAATRNLLYEPDVKVLRPLYNELDTSVKVSEYGQMIGRSLTIAEKLQPGMPAPDFSLADTAGKTVNLSSVKGKYVLVDFWASWCGPCRAENPNVVKAFNKYKAKGFTVFGVSLDDDKQAWEKAIQHDKLDWMQVSDLKGWNNAAAQQYGIRAIPSNFLLDRDGKILARNLRGDALDKKLADILK